MDKQTFLQTFAEPVKEAVSGTGLFASVKLAQMALETGWGDSIKAAGNNCFGIKATPTWPGKVISNTTRETFNGESVVFHGTGDIYDSYQAALDANCNTTTLFKAYPDIAASIRDHNELLLTAPRYQVVRDAQTPEQQAHELQTAGYATAEGYANTLISIIHSNDLTQYDE